MKTRYKEKDIYLSYISERDFFVLATYDPEMKSGYFKIDCDEILDKSVLKKLRKKQNTFKEKE